MITIEFRGDKFTKVRNAWKAYFTRLCEELPGDAAQQAVYYGKRPDVFVEHLQEMANALNYKEFDKTQILKEGYATRYHEEAENDVNLCAKSWSKS